MSTGMKVVLIGCVGVIVVGVIALGLGGWFVKGWLSEKTKTLENVAGTEDSEYGKRIAKLSEEYPFQRPEDNVVSEDQLQRFLEVRKSIFQTYKKYEKEIKEFEKAGNNNPLVAFKGVEFLNDLRLAQASALENQKMSKDEYEFMVQTVYTTWLANTANDVMGGKSISEFGQEQLKRSIEQIDLQLQNPNLPEETRKQLQETKEGLQKQMEDLLQSDSTKKMEDVMASIPPQNVELFKKYDAEIKQYGMSGLEFIGL